MIDRPDWYLRLGYLIHDVSRLRRMMFDRELAPLGITRSQWWVLAFISRKDGLPQTQLANELDVGKVALGALIDRLETSGFVVRQADPVDRRVKRVYLTKQARGFLEKLRKETDKFNAQIVSGIQRSQLETTSDALLAMKRNLLAMSGETMSEDSENADTTKPAKRRKKSLWNSVRSAPADLRDGTGRSIHRRRRWATACRSFAPMGKPDPTQHGRRTIQIAMMTIAAILLRGRCLASLALARYSAMTSSGINDTTSQMPSGTMIKSSRYPRTGMKSGMRSIGESAYPATAIARTLAYQGMRGSRAAR